MRLSSPVTAIRLTIARQRYYARAAAFAQRHAISLYGARPIDQRLFNASYEYALRIYMLNHPRKN